MTLNFGFEGRRVAVVGASSGIGFELARQFALQGADVWIVAQDDGIVRAAQQLSHDAGRPVHPLKCDVTSRSQVATLAGQIEQIDVLINNAGIGGVTSVDDMSDSTAEAVRRTLDVNVLGLYWVTQALLPRLTARGRIIFTTSYWAHTGVPNFSAYVASKHALVGVVQTLAAELGPRGFTVNGVSPGTIDTALIRREVPQVYLDHLCGQMKIRPGLIDPVHLSGAYLFLASDAASEITGQVLAVDRGQSINC
jgi:NAD(P)-dependent dehydrogenase (short-subunit alcohol dehydrogenase family)